MKTTLVLDDALYRQAKVVASQRGATVSSVVEEALRLMLHGDVTASPPTSPMPSWNMGRPRVDLADGRAVRDALDADRSVDALR